MQANATNTLEQQWKCTSLNTPFAVLLTLPEDSAEDIAVQQGKVGSAVLETQIQFQHSYVG